MNGRAQLHVLANITVEFGFDVTYTSFGRVNQGEGSDKVVHLMAKDADNLKSVQFNASSELLSAVIDKDAGDAGKSEGVPVVISLKPGLPMGRFNETITARSNNTEMRPSTVRVSGTIIGDVEVSSESIRFVVLKSAENSIVPAEQKVAIINHSENRSLAIDSYRDPDERLNLTLKTDQDGQEYTLVASPKELGKIDHNLTGKILITTDNPNQKELEVQYSIILQN